MTFIYKAKNGSSRVWQFMEEEFSEENKTTGRVKCKLCKDFLAVKGNTTGPMVNHLKSKHKQHWENNQSKSGKITDHFKPTQTQSQTDLGELEKALIDMIVDGVPINVVEQHGFRKFVSIAAPNYSLPSRQTLRRRVELEYVNMLDKVRHILSTEDMFVITSDLWSSRRHHSYLTIVVLFISNSIIHQFCLCCKKIDGSHTGELISSELLNVFHDFSIENRIYHATTDNAANIRKACRLLNIRQSGCACHLLHLIIVNGCGFWTVNDKNTYLESENDFNSDSDDEFNSNDNNNDELFSQFTAKSVQSTIYLTILKSRKLVCYFRRSNRAIEILREKVANISEIGCNKDLVIDVKTRWNSTLSMCHSILVNKQAIIAALNDDRLANVDDVMLSPTEWRTITTITEILELFQKCTEDLSGSTYPTLCRVYIVRRLLKDHLMIHCDDSEIKRQLKAQLSLQFGKYFESGDYMNQDLLLCATYLDPRTKSVLFSATEKRSAENYIKEYLASFLPTRQEDCILVTSEMLNVAEQSSSNCHQQHQSNPLDDYIKCKQRESIKSQHIHVNVHSLRGEINIYQEMPLESTETNILRWWASRKETFPNLERIAKVIHSIPASSVSAEAYFSRAGNYMRRERSCLSPSLLNKLMFLRSLRDSPLLFENS